MIGPHSSHITRDSDASSFDEICKLCGATDTAGGGWGKLAEPCSNPAPQVAYEVLREMNDLRKQILDLEKETSAKLKELRSAFLSTQVKFEAFVVDYVKNPVK